MNKGNLTLQEKYFQVGRIMMLEKWHKRMEDNGEKRILVLLKGQKQALQTDIGYALHIQKEHLEKLLVRMEKDGLVSFSGKGGETLVCLTEKGNDRAAQPREEEPELLDSLNEEEMMALEASLDKLLEAGKSRLGKKQGPWGKMHEDWGSMMGMGGKLARFMMGHHTAGHGHWGGFDGAEECGGPWGRCDWSKEGEGER